MRHARISIAGLVVAMVVTACSGSTQTTTSTALGTTATTVAETTTTTISSETTTTQQSATTTTTTAETTTLTKPPSNGASGSGCTPGPGDLPDGEWYGFIEGADDASIVFDLACWFSGDAAVTAAAEDGEESPPPNDYYIRNQNPQTRQLSVSSSAMALWYLTGDPNSESDGTYAEWLGVREEREWDLGVWLTVEGGSVVYIAEQWVP